MENETSDKKVAAYAHAVRIPCRPGSEKWNEHMKIYMQYLDLANQMELLLEANPWINRQRPFAYSISTESSELS
jgi:hypothetical protein